MNVKFRRRRSITFHIWTAYSPFTTWVQIVYDWLDALKDPNGLKTFVNTTLGETVGRGRWAKNSITRY
ncbi:large terminase domain protein [Escherichia coli DEC9B]|nr:large terminase domain protein [Escherichia coli DEC9B]